MSREPAGAVILAANQRLKCFCRTRIFLFSPRQWLTLAITVTAICSTIYAGTSTSRERADSSARIFTLNQAVETALQRNPNILRARQEIQRTKGVQIEVRAQALPHLDAAGFFRKIDPNLQSSAGNNFVTVTGTPGVTPTPSATASPTVTPTPSVPPGTRVGTVTGTTNSYDLTLTATQLLYNGSVIPAIRGAAFSRDAAFFSLSDIIDQVIATTRVQFYQVILNKQLIGVQEESVRLLESQLKDQQNRFEAGTVPRFNVLQAEVALANQQPSLITAQNNLRIAQLQLAKTIGLDFNPVRGDQPPLEARGELSFEPREIPLTTAIELGKERRPFLKQQRANVLIQLQQVYGAYAGYQPILNLNGGYEWASSPFSDSIGDVDKGWFFGLTGSWPIFDGLQTYGQVKQQRALLSEARITYDDAVRQVELEIQQAYSNLQQDRQLVAATSKTVEQAREALRLASARLGVGAGVQLDVLNAQVALTQAQSTRLQALSSYNSDQAEFDRATAIDTVYHAKFEDPLTRKRRETRMTKTTTQEPQRTQSSGK